MIFKSNSAIIQLVTKNAAKRGDGEMYKNLQELMESLGGTESQNKVLEYIVENKNTEGFLTPGRLKITYRDLGVSSNVSLGSVTRAFVHWENAGVIHVQPGLNRRDPNTIQYLGPPLEMNDHPLFIIQKEFEELMKKQQDVQTSMEILASRIEFIIRSERDSPISIFREGMPKQVGEYKGKPIYIITNNTEIDNDIEVDGQE